MDWIYSYVRYLRVDPYGDYRNRDYVSIYLCLDDNSNMPPIESAIMAEFTISILNQKNGKHSQQKGSSYQLLQFSIALEFDAFRNRVYIYNPFVFCGELPSCISILLSPSLICFCFLFFFFWRTTARTVFSWKGIAWGWHKFIRRDQMKNTNAGFVVGSSWTVQAEVTVIGSSSHA